MAEMQALSAAIETIGLMDLHSAKHIIHVNHLRQLYNVESFGKKTEPLLNELIRFQILNPRATEEDAERYMLEKKTEFFAKLELV